MTSFSEAASRSHDPSHNGVDPEWAERVVGDLFGSLRRREFPHQNGRRIGLSLPRRFVCDLMHFAKKVPTVPMQRTMRLADVIHARKLWPHRATWSAIFTKALAHVSAHRPELRRAYISFPWGHLYEHPGTLASIGVERVYEGEEAVFFGLVPSPERLRLAEVDALIRFYKTAPLEKITRFRNTLLLSRFPTPIRRFAWWLLLNGRGLYRASFCGTFGLSVVASLGAASLHIPSLITTVLNYGTFADDGSLDVRLTYDHRVMDGATAARAIGELEDVLHSVIVDELRKEAPRPTARLATPELHEPRAVEAA